MDAIKINGVNSGGLSFVVVNPAATGAIIKGIQQGTITITANNTSGTATITSVDTDKSVLIFEGFSPSNNVNTDRSLARISLTNSTTVTATRNTADSSVTVDAQFMVIEYESGINSIQRNVTTTNTTPMNIAITSVDTAKSLVFLLGFTTTNTSLPLEDYPYLKLNSATQLQILGHRSFAVLSVSWQVVEFD